jgi:hypothetical protein
MALADAHCPTPQQAVHSLKHCPACPVETVAPHSDISHHTLENEESDGSCCLAAWLPDTQRMAPFAESHHSPAVEVQSFVLPQPQTDILARSAIGNRAPESAARGGPGSPRGPPAAL